MRNLFVLSALLIGTASLSAHAAPSVSAMQGAFGDTSAIQQVREASEGPRREDRRSDRRKDRRNDRRTTSLSEPTELNNGVIFVREGRASGGNRQRRNHDRTGA